MLKILNKIIFYSFIITGISYADDNKYQAPVKWDGNLYKIIKQYESIHKDFFKKVCSPADSGKYYTLLKDYRGQGFYLPKLGNEIDRMAIIKNLHFFYKKIKFIKAQIARLKKEKEYPSFSILHAEVDQIVLNLLNLKKKYHQAITEAQKKNIKMLSRREVAHLKQQFKIFIDKIFFMQSFGFPNEYLTYRENYEAVKDLDGNSNKLKANEIFFFRKIFEDGTYDPDKSSGDKYIRTALDTLYLNIMKLDDFLGEDVRYDLEWIEGKLDRLIARGKKAQILRLTEWLERTEKNYQFYQDIIEVKNKKKAKSLVQSENEASLALRQFTYSKQAEVYEYWMNQSELMKALFVLETILVHEVGVLDGKHALERISVARVVMNRYFDDFYSQLEPDQPINIYLDPKLNTKNEKWLNVLFKVGEFSFTYHYIPAVSGIHCPDMSRRGKNIRRDNLKIALKVLSNYKGDFPALRYFSRISMMGKIDMSSVWTDYVRLPEMVGYKSLHQNTLSRYYLADNYIYLYSFKSAENLEYNVVKIKDTTYAVRFEKGIPVVYDYRNPHLFAYFSRKN